MSHGHTFRLRHCPSRKLSRRAILALILELSKPPLLFATAVPPDIAQSTIMEAEERAVPGRATPKHSNDPDEDILWDETINLETKYISSCLSQTGVDNIIY
jgi:hypothetical protein